MEIYIENFFTIFLTIKYLFTLKILIHQKFHTAKLDSEQKTGNYGIQLHFLVIES